MGDPFTEQVVDTVGDQAVGRSLPRALQPFRTPAYRRLAVAIVLSSFASGVWVVALVWEVIGIGGGPAELSIVSTASAIGVLVPALLAGVVADRVAQKSILLCVAAVELTGMALVTLLSLADLDPGVAAGPGLLRDRRRHGLLLPGLLRLAAGAGPGLRPPGRQRLRGDGPADDRPGARAGRRRARRRHRLPRAAFAVAATASAAGLVALTAVPRTAVRRDLAADADTHPVRRALTDMSEGFRYMVRTPWLLSSLLFASLMVLVIMGPLEVLVPFLVKDRLGGGPGGHALVVAAFGIGGAIGSIAMASIRMPRRYLTWMVLGWGVSCVPFVVMGMATALWQLVASAFLCGALFSAPMVIWGTLLQRRVPPALLGRVASLDFFVSISLMPVSMALAGPVSNAIGLRATFIIAGVVPLVAAAVAVVWAGAARRRDRAPAA